MQIAGKKITTPMLIGGGALLVGGVWYWRRQAASSGTSTTGGIDPVTGLPYSQDNVTDPVTGMTYLAEAQQYGSVAAAQAATAGNYSSVGGGVAAQDVGYPTSNVGSASPQQGYSTNAQWAQAVQAGLAALGYNQTDIAAALGLFFAQHPLPANYATIVQAAEAEYGPPPQGTYQIIPEPSSSGGASGGGTPGPVQGLHVTGRGRDYLRIAWTPPSGGPATGGQLAKLITYQVQVNTASGKHVRSGSTTSATYDVTGLHKATSYHIYVSADGGPAGSGITAKTLS